MSEKKYIDVTNYQDCKIVLHNEDEGVRIKDIPAADVKEVKHANYDDLPSRKDSFYIRQCSNCLQVGAVGNYCMWCGAKMDGGDK